MQYQSLIIENFRGISVLEINDLKRINLLVGRNNCGKSSVLEAFFLLSGMGVPQLSLRIHTFRDLILANDEDFHYMFRDMNFDKPIVLSGQLDNGMRDLTITPLYADNNLQQPGKGEQETIVKQPDNYIASTNILQHIDGINYDFHDPQNKQFHGQFSLKTNKISLSAAYEELLTCTYLNQRTILLQIDKQLENLLIQKKLDSVLSVLKAIEPNITDIRMGAAGMVYVDVGAENLMPLNIMGDGMRRILTILATISNAKNGLLLIDEIENGFHYTSLKVLWKAILAACKEYNVQLIAATHSYECIEALITTYLEKEPGGDDLRLYRLDKDGDKHKAFTATAEVLKAGIEKNFEVR